MTTSFRPVSGIQDTKSDSSFVHSSKFDPAFTQMRPGDSTCAILFYDPTVDLTTKKIPNLKIHSCDNVHYNCRVELSYESLRSISQDPQITCVAYTTCPSKQDL